MQLDESPTPLSLERTRRITAIRTEKREKAKAAEKKRHIDSGFPHFHSESGRCMCLEECCYGDDGCICRGCKPCKEERRRNGDNGRPVERSG